MAIFLEWHVSICGYVDGGCDFDDEDDVGYFINVSMKVDEIERIQMVDELGFEYFFVVTLLELIDDELFILGTFVEDFVLEVELVFILQLLIILKLLLFLRAFTESFCLHYIFLL